MASIFTDIINGKASAEKVLETEGELAFLDIYPKSEGHTLVVPKREVAEFDALPAKDMRSLITTVQTVARGIVRAMGTPHYNVVVNNGRPAGQVIFHVHFHIIPRHQGGGRSPGPYPPEKMAEIGEKIRRALEELG